ncbi:hypothetical protein NC796_17910 [Aliifodinibius sp. S!AR15-10]|uniref:formyltransferase family protein n=1 Tax=Aliifodinibius sp. S!AR15-10 TaxID=2950437 RepID=UPI0028650FC8|nr:formyltransferase family protein [Aliifodinibius sp. S!AR15-10]MDR8393037.1 hypothetical protein [Aliifodinibius sp. S!AR15-10]
MNKQLQDVLLLATSHNVTKAYVAKLHQAGLRPANILLLSWEQDTRREEVRFDTEPLFELWDDIRLSLLEAEVYSTDLTRPAREVLNEIGWSYKEKTITDINDPSLVNYLCKDLSEKHIIFCGGGILRKPMLNCGKQFIHIHPGVIPDMRGADCLLWSALVKNEIGMSAFFMNEGIDTGNIITTRTFDIPGFDSDITSFPPSVIKEVLVNHVDPHYRAEMLAPLFKNAQDPSNWGTVPQQNDEGKTYYFMHDALLPQALEKFFKPQKRKVG